MRPRNLFEYFLQPGLSVKIAMIGWVLSSILAQENLLSNWLGVLLQERFEDSVETTQDIIQNENGLRIILRNDYQENLLRSGPFPEISNISGLYSFLFDSSKI